MWDLYLDLFVIYFKIFKLKKGKKEINGIGYNICIWNIFLGGGGGVVNGIFKK